MVFGVLQFPGSCDERDAVLACERVGEARLVWHHDSDLGDLDVIVIPGGFSYGDYLRAGAIARFSPIMDAVREHAARGGLLLGICNGFQVLTEAGLLPGALRRNTTLRFEHRWVSLLVQRHDTPFTRGIPAGQTLRLPIAHGEGSFYLADAELDGLEASGQVLFRYGPPEGNPNGSARDIAGVTDSSGRICGLMPHPERASEGLLGSDDGLLLLRSMVESAAQVEAVA